MFYENPFFVRALSRNTLAACLTLSSGFTSARNERHNRIFAIAAPYMLESPPSPIVLLSRHNHFDRARASPAFMRLSQIWKTQVPGRGIAAAGAMELRNRLFGYLPEMP
jgi:hypothetical protein